MNTPAHLIVGAAAFARPDAPKVTFAALFGSLLPDLSLYLLVAWHLLAVRTPPSTIFDEYYFSDSWQSIFAVDNSFILWGAVFAVALWRGWPVLIAFAGAGLLHLALDFPLHHDDGRPHFWPVSDWVFNSPVSYWDPRAYGTVIGVMETTLCLVLLFVLWRRFHTPLPRVAISSMAVLQAAPGVLWAVMFAS